MSLNLTVSVNSTNKLIVSFKNTNILSTIFPGVFWENTFCIFFLTITFLYFLRKILRKTYFAHFFFQKNKNRYYFFIFRVSFKISVGMIASLVGKSNFKKQSFEQDFATTLKRSFYHYKWFLKKETRKNYFSRKFLLSL